MSGDQSPKCPLTQLISFTCLCFIFRTGFVLSSHSDLGIGNRLKLNQTNCSLNEELCPKQLNQICNLSTGQCQCQINKPIHLAGDIPCLRAKLLGHVCLHSMECSSVPNSACFATILFPVELLSIPTYRQWYIYNQITESDELNYLLNKVYGQCRCKAGFRAVHDRKCVSKEVDTFKNCHNTSDCSLPNSRCNFHLNRCLCSTGFYHDPEEDSCTMVGQLHGQFCVVSSDCQVTDPNLQCIKSRCTCAQGYRLTNQTECIPSLSCEPGQVWNKTNSLCESESSIILNSLLVKIVLLVLLKLIICNLIRIACYSKRGITRQNPRIPSRSSCLQNGQSHSLLSLPPYEAIANDSNVSSQVEHLPTYEEALESLRNIRGYRVLSDKQEIEMA